jgi:hypothetical protein
LTKSISYHQNGYLRKNFDFTGQVRTRKARLAARGFSQRCGEHDQTFAPVVMNGERVYGIKYKFHP